jgi:hypothetical protein
LDVTYWTSLAADHTPRGIAVDDVGNAYIAGGTMPVDLPSTFAAFLRNPSVSGWNDLGLRSLGIASSDVFVTKTGPDGKIMWSAIIGGPGYDRADAIEVDAHGFVYVAGRAGRGFPVTPSVFQASFQGSDESLPFGPQDGFVCKLTAATGALVFCSYFGTTDANGVSELAVDGSGNIYLASAYTSGAYPLGVRERFNNQPHVGPQDAVLAKVKGDGSSVLWATYLGGSNMDGEGASVRVDPFDNPYFLTTTTSTDALTTPRALGRVYRGDSDLYLARLTPDTGQVMWATYLGGSSRESAPAHNLAVDRAGAVTIAMSTLSPDLPTTPGAFQRMSSGGSDMFIARLAPDGSRVVAGTYLGGRSDDRAEAVAIDARGSVHLVGATDSPDFPIIADASRLKPGGTRDTVMVELSPDLSHVTYATYLESVSNGYARGVAVDGRGNRYLVGEPGIVAAQAGNGGRLDSFVLKFTPR